MREHGVMEPREIVKLVREAPAERAISCTDTDILNALRDFETAARLLLSRQLSYIAEADRRGLAVEHGARNTKALLQQVCRISGADADSRTKVARKVAQRTGPAGEPLPPELPATAQLLRSGKIGIDHARAIVDGMRKITGLVSPQQCEDAEIFLAEQARLFGQHEVHTLAERLAYHADQDGALREEERQFENRELHFGVARDGMTVLKGRLDRETGAKLRAALEPLAAPRPESNGEKDPRTAGQRNADALADVLDIALSADRLPRAGGQRPHVTVTVSMDSLREWLPGEPSRAPGVLETTGQAITAEQLRRVACDAEILPMVLGGEGQPLDVGRTQRTAPPHLRAALFARDGGCAFPSCDHPPGTAEAHHLRHWADGGETALNNLVILCAHHHRLVHSQQWDIELDDNGRPVFVPPSTVDPCRQPRPGNRPLHQLELTPLAPS